MDKASTIVLALSLIIIMLGMGLTLVWDDFKRILLYPKAIVLGLVNQIIILPLIGFTLVSLFPLSPEIAIGVMILAACPGGPTSNLISHLAKADLALSVSLTAVSSFITILTIPFIVNFALIRFLEEGQIIQLDVVQTILQIFAIIVIPVAIGMLIRKFKEPFALRMAKPVRIASGFVLAMVIVGIMIKENDKIISYFQQAGIVTLCLNIATMLVGFYSAKLFKLDRKQAISISIESGIQNGTLAISIAVVLLGSTAYSIAPAIYSLLMFASGGMVIWLSLRKQKGKES